MILECPDLTENKFVSYYASLGDSVFRFSFRWNDYCGCCFLDIYDGDGNAVRTGNALCANRLIKGDTRVLPDLCFIHKEGLALEPTQETLKDYALADITN